MHSWMGDVSQAAQGELDRLLDAGLEAAKQQLLRVSDFLPFAHAMGSEGKVLVLSQDLSELGRHPEPEAVIEDAVGQLRHLKRSLRASSVIINTRLQTPRTDAIEVRLEHLEGAALLVLLPYKRAKFGGKIEFGELKAFPGTPEVWG